MTLFPHYQAINLDDLKEASPTDYYVGLRSKGMEPLQAARKWCDKFLDFDWAKLWDAFENDGVYYHFNGECFDENLQVAERYPGGSTDVSFGGKMVSEFYWSETDTFDSGTANKIKRFAANAIKQLGELYLQKTTQP